MQDGEVDAEMRMRNPHAGLGGALGSADGGREMVMRASFGILDSGWELDGALMLH